jgi:D-xylose transport system substrate-binding protein
MPLRNILLVVSLALSIVIGILVSQHGGSGTAATAGSAHTLTIGLSLDTLKEERWQSDRDRFVQRCRELHAQVLVQSANSDDSVQMQNIQSLLSSHIDCLVIVPHDGEAMAQAVTQAKAMGIPVIAYDRLIRNCDLDLYCSFDNQEVGRQQARFLVDRLGGKGNIVRIYGAPTDNNAKLFKAGQDEVLAPYLQSGAITVVHEDWAEDWKPENAKKIASAAITKGVAFQGILASNDGTAGGAIQALSEEHLAHIVVTGQDAEISACQRIAAGSQTMTIYKPLESLADGAAEMAVALASRAVVVANGRVDNGRRSVPAVLYQVLTVTRDNLVQAVVQSGFHRYDDVYKGVPDAERPPRPPGF